MSKGQSSLCLFYHFFTDRICNNVFLKLWTSYNENYNINILYYHPNSSSVIYHCIHQFYILSLCLPLWLTSMQYACADSHLWTWYYNADHGVLTLNVIFYVGFQIMMCFISHCDYFHNEGLKELKVVLFVKIFMFYMKMELWKFLWPKRTVQEVIHVLQGIN